MISFTPTSDTVSRRVADLERVLAMADLEERRENLVRLSTDPGNAIEAAGDWFRAIQILRDRGTISAETAGALFSSFFFCARVELMETDPEIVRLDAGADRVLEAHGIADGLDQPLDQLPPEYQRLTKQSEQRLRDLEAAFYRNHGEDDLARLFESDRAAHEALVARGREAVLGDAELVWIRELQGLNGPPLNLAEWRRSVPRVARKVQAAAPDPLADCISALRAVWAACAAAKTYEAVRDLPGMVDAPLEIWFEAVAYSRRWDALGGFAAAFLLDTLCTAYESEVPDGQGDSKMYERRCHIGSRRLFRPRRELIPEEVSCHVAELEALLAKEDHRDRTAALLVLEARTGDTLRDASDWVRAIQIVRDRGLIDPGAAADLFRHFYIIVELKLGDTDPELLRLEAERERIALAQKLFDSDGNQIADLPAEYRALAERSDERAAEMEAAFYRDHGEGELARLLTTDRDAYRAFLHSGRPVIEKSGVRALFDEVDDARRFDLAAWRRRVPRVTRTDGEPSEPVSECTRAIREVRAACVAEKSCDPVLGLASMVNSSLEDWFRAVMLLGKAGELEFRIGAFILDTLFTAHENALGFVVDSEVERRRIEFYEDNGPRRLAELLSDNLEEYEAYCRRGAKRIMSEARRS